MLYVRPNLRTTFSQLPKSGILCSSPSVYQSNLASRSRRSRRGFPFPASPQTHFRNVSTITRRLNENPRQRTVVALLCVGAVLAAAYRYGYIKLQVQWEVNRPDGLTTSNHPSSRDPCRRPDNSPTTTNTAEEIALRTEFVRYLRQAMFYQDKDPEGLRNAFRIIIQFMDQHPHISDPLTIPGLLYREEYWSLLAEISNHTNLLRETDIFIDMCKRKLEEYDQHGIQNLPLQRDVLLSVGERAQAWGVIRLKPR